MTGDPTNESDPKAQAPAADAKSKPLPYRAGGEDAALTRAAVRRGVWYVAAALGGFAFAVVWVMVWTFVVMVPALGGNLMKGIAVMAALAIAPLVALALLMLRRRGPASGFAAGTLLGLALIGLMEGICFVSILD